MTEFNNDHPIFDMCEEVPTMITDSILAGVDKLRSDKDADEFVVTIKINGHIEGKTLVLGSKVKCTTKAELVSVDDECDAPLDNRGKIVPRSERVYATPIGEYLGRETA